MIFKIVIFGPILVQFYLAYLHILASITSFLRMF